MSVSADMSVCAAHGSGSEVAAEVAAVESWGIGKCVVEGWRAGQCVQGTVWRAWKDACKKPRRIAPLELPPSLLPNMSYILYVCASYVAFLYVCACVCVHVRVCARVLSKRPVQTDAFCSWCQLEAAIK